MTYSSEDTELLSIEEEVDLFTKYKSTTDVETRNQISNHIILSNTRLVLKIANEYIGQGLPYEELISYGNMGLMRAFYGYKLGTGAKFSTYASYFIKLYIREALTKSSTIRIPSHIKILLRKIMRYIEEGIKQGIEYTDDEIKNHFKLTDKKFKLLYDIWFYKQSLSYIEKEDSYPTNIILLTNQDDSIEDDINTKLLNNNINSILNILTPKKKQIIILRYGLYGNDRHTLQEIADMYGVTHECIRLAEVSALKKLRSFPNIDNILFH